MFLNMVLYLKREKKYLLNLTQVTIPLIGKVSNTDIKFLVYQK